MDIPPAWLEQKLRAELRWLAAATRVQGSRGDPADISAAAQALADVIDAQLLIDIARGLPPEPLGTTPDTH